MFFNVGASGANHDVQPFHSTSSRKIDHPIVASLT